MARKRSSLTKALQHHQNKTLQLAKRPDEHSKKSLLAKTGKQASVGRNPGTDDQTKPRPLSMVDKGDRVLLVGEGNFSFTVTLVVNHGHPGKLVTASTIDSKESVLEKYPDAGEFLKILEENHVTVLFELDACNLNRDKRIKGMVETFDKVIFNFPHVGGSEPDQDRSVLANQILVLRFLRSVARFLFRPVQHVDHHDPSSSTITPRKRRNTLDKSQHYPRSTDDSDSDDHPRDPDDSDPEMDLSHRRLTRKAGSVLITTGTCSPYSLWDVPKLAKHGGTLAHTILYPSFPALKSSGDQPTYKVIRSFDFDRFISGSGSGSDHNLPSSSAPPPYQHRQTNGFKHSSMKDSKPASPRTWEFQFLS